MAYSSVFLLAVIYPPFTNSFILFNLGSSHRFFLYDQPCDMRRSFDGLAGMVHDAFDRSPTDGSVYIFINKNRDRVKLLYWEYGGFVLYYKRLEQGQIERPKDSSTLQISYATLVMLIEGISQDYLRKKVRYGVKKS